MMLKPLRRFILPLVVGIGFAAAIGLSLQPPRAEALSDPFVMPPQQTPNTPTPVVVELFTSEGCSSCPAADDLLTDLVMMQSVKGARILALGFHVDYWNDLGWPDRFSKPQFTARQRAYAETFRNRRIYTPQMVVDGVEEFTGSDRTRATSAIQKAAARPHLPVSIQVDRSKGASDPDSRHLRIQIDSLNALRDRKADLVLAITEEQLASDVKRGENTGRYLEHISVVRHLDRVAESLGEEDSAEFSTILELDPEWNAHRLSATVFIQRHADQRILGAAQIPLTVVAVPGSSS